MKKGYKWSLTTLICAWMEVLSVVMMIWIGASWVEVVSKNSNPDSQICEYNLLQMMVNADLKIHNKN